MYDDELCHYGIKRKSGRWPFGSGEDPYQHEPWYESPEGFYQKYNSLKKDMNMTEKEIADEFGYTINELRARKSLAKDLMYQNNVNEALKLSDKGWSNVAIGKKMGVPESTVRNWLNPVKKERRTMTENTANRLEKRLDEYDFIDVGVGVENYLGVSRTKLKTALQLLKEKGYNVYNIPVEQVSTGKDTTTMVLAKPGVEWKDVVQNKEKIGLAFGDAYTEDGGRTWLGIEPPKSVNSKRVQVVYGEEGGKEKDGVIELRRGVEDLSLGNSRYAQVRIAVDDTHYLKGMAVYSDDLPDGVDIRFNTNKHNTGNKLDAMKKLEEDPDNPFKATIRQRHYTDKDGKEQLSPINLVASGDKINEEGRWAEWSKTLASQFLSKQPPKVAKQQLDERYNQLHDEYEEIMSYTNPAVRKKLLLSFAESCDASAEHLEAAAMPRQTTSVILPVNSLKPTEVYAPNYRNGESVILIRYPHGGIFEIPECKVNNNNKEGKKLLGNATDAIGINHHVAEQLSGADFDGDNVIVIPTNGKTFKTSKAKEALINFDPKEKYTYPDPNYPPKIKDATKQRQMGEVSNLITDMTIKGATDDELVRAVKHSMVVIDAQKHHLNYKQSALDNDIKSLKEKYQSSPEKARAGGASTLISRSTSEINIPQRKDKLIIDPKTGKQSFEETGKTYYNAKGKTLERTQKASRMSLTDDAFSLSSGTVIETVYATHANKLKALANQARKEYVAIKGTKQNQSAKEAYAKEVKALEARLDTAQKNAPLERYAQRLAGNVVKSKYKAAKESGTKLSDKDAKKIKQQAISEARTRTGAKKQLIPVSDREWEAIQAGAFSFNTLTAIINNMDENRLKELALPKTAKTMTPAKTARAKTLLKNGYTQAEVAKQLGVSVTTLTNSIK